jgi:P-type E1-E2 ATPase
VPPDVKLKGRATWIGLDGKTAGVIVIQDELRESARGLGQTLHAIGIERVVLATGDQEEAEARRVSELIGADEYRWGLRPEDKTTLVKELRAQGVTIMVGDGVNDATSLAAAGLLSPWLAALFHHISSVMVVLNSARLVHNERASF